MIRNRKEIQQLKENNKFYRVCSLVWKGQKNERERKKESEKMIVRQRKREREKGRMKKEKKQRKSAYTPVNYCLACVTRFMRVRSVSITGLKELKTTLRRKQ